MLFRACIYTPGQPPYLAGLFQSEQGQSGGFRRTQIIEITSHKQLARRKGLNTLPYFVFNAHKVEFVTKLAIFCY
jgi:hypothetical protein